MGRRIRELSTRNEFYIITNGKETECNYFELLKSRHSIYEVKIIYKNEDPIRLVELAKTHIKNANQVWCVFDIDNTYKEKRLIPALKEAKKCGINIAYSNIAFEVWLISHFKKCKASLQINEYEKELNSVLKENNTGKNIAKQIKLYSKISFCPNIKQQLKIQKLYTKIILKNIIIKTMRCLPWFSH